jgi:hypothetical protein
LRALKLANNEDSLSPLIDWNDRVRSYNRVRSDQVWQGESSMMVHYPTRYSDRFGDESTSIGNDGHTLSMVLRGVRFESRSFDDFEPAGEIDPDRLASFNFASGSLCSCTIDTDILLPITTPTGIVEGVLAAHLELGDPTPTGGIDREQLTLELRFGDVRLKSGGRSGFFEEEMLDIQKQLPPGTYMLACTNCAFSDYHPAGQGLFGGLACFRTNKTAYLAVRSKRDLLRVWDTMTEFVQETYLCPAFERRNPGTGYRG